MTPRDQPDSLAAHFEFLNRAEAGPAVIIIEDVKLGRQLSTLHVSLYQHDLLPQAPWVTQGSSRKVVVGYITCTNLASEKGLSLPTSFTVRPLPSPANLSSLKLNDGDENWKRWVLPKIDIRNPSTSNIVYYIPRQGHPSKSLVDCWMRFTCGEPFTNSSLTFVADSWPFIVESYRAARGEPITEGVFPSNQVYWYPTVVFNMDVKKSLPAAGTEWLRMRVEAKSIRNGRLDLEMLIFDEAGDLVAISQHVNLILDASRNTAKRTPKSNI